MENLNDEDATNDLIQEQLQSSSSSSITRAKKKSRNSGTWPCWSIHLELISISNDCVIINVVNWKRELNVKQETRPVISQFRTWHMTYGKSRTRTFEIRNRSCNSFFCCYSIKCNNKYAFMKWHHLPFVLQSIGHSIDPRPFTLTKLP